MSKKRDPMLIFKIQDSIYKLSKLLAEVNSSKDLWRLIEYVDYQLAIPSNDKHEIYLLLVIRGSLFNRLNSIRPAKLPNEDEVPF